METTGKISDYFWGENGFPTVEAWINQTKDSSSYLAYFMKERAQIEEMYAARLQQLLKNTMVLTEFGSSREAWLAIRGETENVINNSKQLAETLMKGCYQPLSTFKESASKLKKQYLADAWKLNKENEKLKQNLQKTKEKYEKYSQETEKAQLSFEAAKAQNKPANELLKMTGKVQKLAKETMMFERDTQDCTNKLASFQTVLAAKMANIYDFLQKQEEERIEFIKTHLIKFVAAMEANAGYMPLACSRMRERIELIDKNHDINCFISEKMTGTEKPKPSDIVFVPIRRDVYEATVSSPMTPSFSNSNYEQPQQPYYDEEPQAEEQSYTQNQMANGGVLGECRALYDYVGSDQHELDFFAGDVIQILEKDYESGWWTGEFNGRIGLFPSNYIEEL